MANKKRKRPNGTSNQNNQNNKSKNNKKNKDSISREIDIKIKTSK